MALKNTILFPSAGMHYAGYPKMKGAFKFERLPSHFDASINKISLGHPARVSSYAVVEGAKLSHRGFRSENFRALVKAKLPKSVAWELSHRSGLVRWGRKGEPVVSMGAARREAKRIA